MEQIGERVRGLWVRYEQEVEQVTCVVKALNERGGYNSTTGTGACRGNLGGDALSPNPEPLGRLGTLGSFERARFNSAHMT